QRIEGQSGRGVRCKQMQLSVTSHLTIRRASPPITPRKRSVTDMLHYRNGPEMQENPLSRAFLLLFVQCFLCLML
ncbi:hypothetical protein, partial [uncultured Senegalimassilia sp.]|uniref:hypothetical protein n=1 Tax=uncultured Senegalimassilia sp. TaxID=1714350 RepID=UPI0025EDFC17